MNKYLKTRLDEISADTVMDDGTKLLLTRYEILWAQLSVDERGPGGLSDKEILALAGRIEVATAIREATATLNKIAKSLEEMNSDGIYKREV